MNMHVIDIEKIVREEVRKLVGLEIQKSTSTSRRKTRVDVIRGLAVNESHTFRCPKGKSLGNFRNSADETARYVGRRYGAKYRTHRVDGGLQVTRVS